MKRLTKPLSLFLVLTIYISAFIFAAESQQIEFVNTLQVTLATDKSTYYFGESVRVSGTVNSTLTMQLTVRFTEIYKRITEDVDCLASGGAFSLTHVPSVVGYWQISAVAVGLQNSTVTSNSASITVKYQPKTPPVGFVETSSYVELNNSMWILRCYKDTAGYDMLFFPNGTTAVYNQRIYASYMNKQGKWVDLATATSVSYVKISDSAYNVTRTFMDASTSPASYVYVTYTVRSDAPVKMTFTVANGGEARRYRWVWSLDGIAFSNYAEKSTDYVKTALVFGNERIDYGWIRVDWSDVYEQFKMDVVSYIVGTSAIGKKADLTFDWATAIAAGQTFSIDPTIEGGAAPTIGGFQAPSMVYANSYFLLNCTVNDADGAADVANATLTIGSVTLLWENSTATFREYSDPDGLCVLDSAGSFKSAVNSTAFTLSFRLKLSYAFTEGYTSVSGTVIDGYGSSGSDSASSLFYFEDDVAVSAASVSDSRVNPNEQLAFNATLAYQNGGNLNYVDDLAVGLELNGQRLGFVNNTGLVGYWSFNEGSGSAAYDLTSNGNNGTVYGASWVDGKYGKALSFNGVNNYVNIAHSSSLSSFSNQITLAAWVNTNTLTTDASITRRIISKSTYILAFSDKVMFRLKIGGATYDVMDLTPKQTGTWYHIAGVYNGTKMLLYVNGALAASASYSGNIDSSTADLRIGCETTSTGRFNGIIDDPRIYSRALSPAEISALMYTTCPERGKFAFYNVTAPSSLATSYGYNVYAFTDEPAVQNQTVNVIVDAVSFTEQNVNLEADTVKVKAASAYDGTPIPFVQAEYNGQINVADATGWITFYMANASNVAFGLNVSLVSDPTYGLTTLLETQSVNYTKVSALPMNVRSVQPLANVAFSFSDSCLSFNAASASAVWVSDYGCPIKVTLNSLGFNDWRYNGTGKLVTLNGTGTFTLYWIQPPTGQSDIGSSAATSGETGFVLPSYIRAEEVNLGIIGQGQTVDFEIKLSWSGVPSIRLVGITVKDCEFMYAQTQVPTTFMANGANGTAEVKFKIQVPAVAAFQEYDVPVIFKLESCGMLMETSGRVKFTVSSFSAPIAGVPEIVWICLAGVFAVLVLGGAVAKKMKRKDDL